MKIGVLGAGHFAGVVAHCLRLKKHIVYQWDAIPELLREEQPLEPGASSIVIGWASDVSVLATCDLLWAAYDVPLDATGRATRIDDIVSRIGLACTVVPRGTVVLLSSQWPVGTTARLEAIHPNGTDLYRQFVYVMENVRVGRAIEDFLQQQAMILGTRHPDLVPAEVYDLLAMFLTGEVEADDDFLEMSPESAELAKQALNAWLGLNIAFINEIGKIAHATGAVADDVARALHGDGRVSPTTPLRPGPPFGGGSLQRDILALTDLSIRERLRTPLLGSILLSNSGVLNPYAGMPKLSKLGAELLHVYAGMKPKDGHAGNFAECPHEDCRAVQ